MHLWLLGGRDEAGTSLTEELDPDYQGAQDAAVQKEDVKAMVGGGSLAPFNDTRLRGNRCRRTRAAPRRRTLGLRARSGDSWGPWERGPAPQGCGWRHRERASGGGRVSMGAWEAKGRLHLTVCPSITLNPGLAPSPFPVSGHHSAFHVGRLSSI